MSSKWLIFFICIILINDLTPAPIRIKRSKGQRVADIAKRAASKVWRASKKVFIYTIILVGGTVVGNEVLKKVDEWSGPVYLERVQVNCKANNYGCAEKLCWANCGPRMRLTTGVLRVHQKNFKVNLCSQHLKTITRKKKRHSHTSSVRRIVTVIRAGAVPDHVCWAATPSCSQTVLLTIVIERHNIFNSIFYLKI